MLFPFYMYLLRNLIPGMYNHTISNIPCSVGLPADILIRISYNIESYYVPPISALMCEYTL